MVEPPQRRLQALLQAAVQTVQWTYSIYWQFCPQQGIIVWSDGYYNGAIKTRKTVQATEESAEEATLQRSQQLRDLYETLAAGETSHQQERRPSASLSPEDLTESEWFYLMCVSFSFPPGIGLPGKAYVDRQHIWLTRANKADSKLFSRAILAESAKIQTVVCIPILDGIVELGTTERVQEDMEMMERVKSIFIDYQNPNPPAPRPALSSHSSSNPTSSSAPRFYSPLVLPPFEPPQLAEEEEDDDDEEEDEVGSDSDPVHRPDQTLAEAMQLDMSDQDIRVGSPDDSSNNLGSNFHHLNAGSQLGNSSDRHGHAGTDMLRWPCNPIINQTHLQPSHSVDVIAEEDTHYSQTVSSILENQSNRWSKLSSSAATSACSSAFTKWLAAPSSSHRRNLLLDGASQWVLKYILFTLPLLYSKPREAASGRRGSPNEELNGNHVLAERRRREKLNERFVTLRSMVPFVTKMDKASILADTIEYLKQLKKRIQELESRARKMEKEKEKRKTRVAESWKVGGQEAVEVSIIESEGLVEISCLHRGGLLLDVMQALAGLGLQVTTVQSSLDNAATFNAELRAKVKENVNGRKASIMEVKRTLKQIIQPH